MGTRKNRLAETILTSTHTLCFGPKIRTICIHLHTVFTARTCFPGVYLKIICIALLPRYACIYVNMHLYCKNRGIDFRRYEPTLKMQSFKDCSYGVSYPSLGVSLSFAEYS